MAGGRRADGRQARRGAARRSFEAPRASRTGPRDRAAAVTRHGFVAGSSEPAGRERSRPARLARPECADNRRQPGCDADLNAARASDGRSAKFGGDVSPRISRSRDVGASDRDSGPAPARHRQRTCDRDGARAARRTVDRAPERRARRHDCRSGRHDRARQHIG